MLEAKVDGEPVQAGPDSPEVAQRPVCGSEVRKVERHGHTPPATQSKSKEGDQSETPHKVNTHYTKPALPSQNPTETRFSPWQQGRWIEQQ
jgi:hypothetical protein